jgi:hypothetical protein
MKYVLMIPTFMHFTSLVVQAAGPPAVPGENVERSSQPNLVVFLADDMNYECCCSEVTARENRCFSRSSEMNRTGSNRGEFSSVPWD